MWERAKNLGWWLIGAAMVIAILFVFATFSLTGDAREVSGVALGVVSDATNKSHRAYIRVELESGHEVLARLPNTTPIIAGRRVVVSEADRIFGLGQKYRFLRYESP
jgi:translation initiation factor IF-1